MSFVLLRSMKVQKADGSYEMRQPGQAIPEAASWPNPGLWVKRGYIRPTDGKILSSERGERKPTRAVTEADIADWNTKKLGREAGDIEPKPFVPGETGSGTDGDGVVNLDELLALSKEDLLALAETNGVEIKRKSSKEDIAQAILDANAAS